MASARVKEVGISSWVLKQMAGTLWLIGSCFQNVDQSLFGGWRLGPVEAAGLLGWELANEVYAGPPRRPEPLCLHLYSEVRLPALAGSLGQGEVTGEDE